MARYITNLKISDLDDTFRKFMYDSTSGHISDEKLQQIWIEFWDRLEKLCTIVEKND